MLASVLASRARHAIETVFIEPIQHFRWSYVPPLMIYFAAGVSGLIGIVGTFFVKEYLNLSAAFLAGLAFWAGLPWALKMPLGHLVDILWRRKAILVFMGAALIGASLLIMYSLTAHTETMTEILPAEVWFVLSALLAPTGYVMQDVVADAMTAEAIPTTDRAGKLYSEHDLKAMHTTMQTLGRFALISGLVAVAALNILAFDGIEQVPIAEKARIYSQIYLAALVIPVLSIAGVVLNELVLRARASRLRTQGFDKQFIQDNVFGRPPELSPDWWLLGGTLGFAMVTIAIGTAELPFSQELTFALSMAIVIFLLRRLVKVLAPVHQRSLVATAVIIFAFRAVPLPGPGATWFEIDVLGFDQQFIAVLSLITSCLALIGMLLIRPLVSSRSLAWIVVALTLVSAMLALPNIGLYYGVHEWTAAATNGVVDARFIAILDTAVESPLGQIAMIPMLAWIARSAPEHLKATFFAVMASFTNLALSASSLLTRYLNQIFVVEREVLDPASKVVVTAANYDNLGHLLITTALLGLAIPLLAVWAVKRSAMESAQ